MTANTRKTTRNKANRIPEFSSLEEEAEFWDTHDFTDYVGEFEPVKAKIADDFKSIYVKGTRVKDALEKQMKKSSKGITVRFQPDILTELRHRAIQKGIGATTLVRIWVMERLSNEQGYSSVASK